jgi:two-component system, NarL family, sensor kinase
MYFNRVGMLQTSTQETIIAISAGTIVLGILGAFIISFLLIYQKKQQKNRLEREQLQVKFNQALLETQLEIQEQTLKTISQEIHDNIGQALTLAKLNLNTILPAADEQLHQKIVNSKELVSKAIGDLRDLSRSLDTDYVKEMGLQRAIEYELEMMQKTGTITTRLQVDGPMIRLDKQKELILFRIVQETFNNIIKHAEATSLDVTIGYQQETLELRVADDGKGVDLTPLHEGNNNNFGLGIRNMHNRAKLIGADFSINSSLGKGTVVKIVLAIENSNHENKQ